MPLYKETKPNQTEMINLQKWIMKKQGHLYWIYKSLIYISLYTWFYLFCLFRSWYGLVYLLGCTLISDPNKQKYKKYKYNLIQKMLTVEYLYCLPSRFGGGL